MTQQEQIELLKELYPTYDIYQESVAAAKKGQESFQASDGVQYQIPQFQLEDAQLPTPAPEDETEETAELRDEDGTLNLDKYQEVENKLQPVPEQGDLVFEDQINNPELIASLQRRFGSSYSNQELIEKWAGEQHAINYNLGVLAIDAATLDNLTSQEKKDYLLQMETWDRVKAFGDGSQSFWDQTLEIGEALLKDPTTYVGVGTLGIGVGAKAGAKQATKESVKYFLKQSTREGIKTGAKIGAIEGGVYATADDALRQVIEQKGQEKIDSMIDVDIDGGRLATSAAFGTVLGGAAGGVLGGVGAKLTKKKTAAEKFDEIDPIVDTTTATKQSDEIEVKLDEGEATVVEQPTQEEVVGEAVQQADKTYDDIDFDPLPKNLRGAKPTYKKTRINFLNDVQKAAYIAGNTKETSKHYETYTKFAMEQLGMSREDVIKVGKYMRAYIADEIAKQPDGKLDVIDIASIKLPGEKEFPKTRRVKKTPVLAETEITPEMEQQVIDELTKLGEELTPENIKKGLDELGIEVDIKYIEDLAKKVEELDFFDDTMTRSTPEDGAPINYTKIDVEDDKIARAIIENDRAMLGTKSNDEVEQAAHKLRKSLDTPEKKREFLRQRDVEVTDQDVKSVVIRQMYAIEANKMSAAWETAKTVQDRVDIVLNNPQLMDSLHSVAIMVQKASNMAGRVLQSQKINVKVVNEILGDIADKVKIVQDRLDKNGGKFDIEDVMSAFTEEELEALTKDMDRLIAETRDHNDHLRRGLPDFSRNESIFMKFSRVLTEIWLSANLYNLATQTGALVGSALKRTTMKGEAYLTWAIGKTFNMKDRMKWNEMRALQQADYAQALQTGKMVFRMFKGGTGEGMSGVLQRESLDGWSTRWDDEAAHGAIYSGYLGFEDPTNFITRGVNKVIDGTGHLVRGSFTALTLADDAMKRIYYLPHIRYQLTKQANDLFPDNPTAHRHHIEKGIKAYELFYAKKGMRTNTMKIHVAKTMEEFEKANPNATYEQLVNARSDAMEQAEKLVEFNRTEKWLLDEVGINDEIHENAMEYLRTMLFQNDIPVDQKTWQGKALGAVTSFRDMNPLMQTQVPYLKTLLNMAKDTLQRTPVLNVLSRDMRADWAAGGERRASTVAKTMMGLSFISIGHMLSNEGIITPSSDYADYETDSGAGMAGGMIHIRGVDIPLNRIDPIGSFLLIGANYKQLTQEADRLEQIIKLAKVHPDAIDDLKALEDMKKTQAGILFTLATQIFTEKSMAESIRQLIRVIENPESDYAEQWINRYTTGFIPAHSGIRQMFETESYEAKTWGEHALKKIGLLRAKYGDRNTINYLGEKNDDIYRIGYFHWRTTIPKANDPVLAEMYRIRPGIQKADNVITLGGTVIDLDYKDTYTLQTYMNHPYVRARQTLLEIINSPEYKALPDGIPGEKTGPFQTKISVLKKVYRQLKEDAMKQYIADNEKSLVDKYKAGVSVQQLQSEIGSGTTIQRAKALDIRR